MRGDYKLTDSYRKNDQGRYILESSGSMQVYLRGETIMTATTAMILSEMTGKTHWIRFIITAASRTKRWFRKEILNLSDTDQLKIEVTTLTLEELANLADPDVQAYYGVDLDSVNLIYLSGHGTYAAETCECREGSTAAGKKPSESLTM